MNTKDIVMNESIIKGCVGFLEKSMNGNRYSICDELSSWGLSGQEIYDLWEEYIDVYVPFKVCDVCGNVCFDGYYDGDRTEKYYCSDKCLETDYTMKEWRDLYEEDGDSYYVDDWG